MNGDKERFNGCKAFQKVLDGEFIDLIKYTSGDSMNGTPTVSWQRLCAIFRVKLKVTKSSVKS